MQYYSRINQLNTEQGMEKMANSRASITHWFLGNMQILLYPQFDEQNVLIKKPVMLIRIAKDTVYQAILDIINPAIKHLSRKNLKTEATKKSWSGRWSGFRNLEENLSWLRKFAEANNLPDTKIISFQNRLKKMILIRNNDRQKKQPSKSINSNELKILPTSKKQMAPSVHIVKQVSRTIMHGNQAKEKTYYFKQNIGAINDMEAYVSAKFTRLLGKQRVGRCRTILQA